MSQIFTFPIRSLINSCNSDFSMLKKLKKYVENPKFKPEIVEKVSKAAKSLCMWVLAIELYARVFRTVQPKRQK